ncbi:MAG: ABC transporter ATP-binding protein [Anaerotignum sp.]|nr:ABC transporter ATP-binding protein [Anaerotignum sp.]
MKSFAFLFKFTWKFSKKYILSALAYQFIAAGIPLVNVILPKYIIDGLIDGRDANYVLCLSFVLVSANLLLGLLSHAFRATMFTSKSIVFNKFQCLISEKLIDADYEYLENPDFLDIKEKARKFLYADGQGFGIVLDSVINIIGKLFIFVGLITIILTLNIYIVILFIILVVLNSIMESNVKKNYTSLELEKAPIERRTNYFLNIIEDFSYGKEIRINDAKNFFITKVSRHLSDAEQFYKKQMKLSNKAHYFNELTAFLRALITYSYLIFNVVYSKIGIGDFTMYLNAMMQFSSAMNDVMKSVLNIRQFSGYYDALNKYLNAPTKKGKGPCLNAPQEIISISFHHVWFKYPGQASYTLHDINVDFSAGKKYSIVGENGAGKTTFLKLLARLYEPTKGYITLNGINIKDIDYEKYQSILSTVFQDYKLFAFTIKENLVFDKLISDEKIYESLQKSGFSERLETLPKGIYSYIYKYFESDGFEPSGGESQKIAMARALLKDTPIIILDEPTAALDPRAEHDLYVRFNELVEHKTAFYVSHRLSSSKFCDEIMVFQKGTIVEIGNHQDLIGKDGIYAELYGMQSEYYIDQEV